MKKLIYSLAVCAGALTMASCNDFLTENIRGSQNLDTYFANEEEVNSFVGGCYFEITKGGDWWQVYNAWLMSDMTTDDLWDGNTTQDDGYQDITHFMPNASSSGIVQNFWGARYQGITTCNIALEKMPGASMDATKLARAMAEVRFLRAFFYFDLVRNFGGVPLITEFTGSTEGVERSSIESCYAFIETELKAAADVLPQRSEYPAADMGRATRGAALGILGKAQLYQGKWAEAKATLQTIIDEKEYDLLPDFGDVWSAKHNNSIESLFEVQQAYLGETYNLGGSLTIVTGCRNGVGDGWSWGQPTADLENAFIAAGDNIRLRWTIIKTACTEIAGEDQFDKFIANNSSIGKINEDKFQSYKELFGWTDAVYNSAYIIDPAQHKSARIIRKYFLPIEDRPETYGSPNKVPLNHRVLRYADVLLMYAEACVESGDNTNAQVALNKVRKRVNLAPVTSTGTALRDAIRAERRLELAHEQCRLYDIRRWTCDNGKKMMCNIFGPDGSFVKYNTGDNADMYEKYNQGETSDKGIRFVENRDLLWPIPNYEIQNGNGAIVQNPGY